MSELNGAAAKVERDLGDKTQRWALLYEDRDGGYVGRLEDYSIDVVSSRAKFGDPEGYYVLYEAAAFTERRAQVSALIPQPPPAGLTQPQLVPVWAPWQWQRGVWPLATNPKALSLTIPCEKIVHVELLADALPMIRGFWEAELQAFDTVCLAILRENAAGGPGLSRIELATQLPKGERR